jgi:hypothetical protein
LDYAFVWKSDVLGTAQTVNSGDGIIFDQAGVFAPNSTFTFTPSSTTVTIHSEGAYLARYVVTLASGHAVPSTFAIALNGVVLEGTDRSSWIAGGAGSITMVGERIFTISTSPPIAVTVVNAGNLGAGATTVIGSELPATTSASLCIQKLGN